MDRSLVITARFHHGRYHGEDDRFDGGSGWPPSPGRLFQALVAGAARGANLLPADARALEWLEELDPPRVVAARGCQGRAVNLFVPNNDLDAKGGDPERVGEIRVSKQWRPVFFDSSEPVLYVWDLETVPSEARRVCEIASRLYQLGRGIDMAWAIGEVIDESEAAGLLASHSGVTRRPGGPGEVAVPHSGTLDSLARRYLGKRRRLRLEGSGRKARQLFVQPPRALFGRTGYDTPPQRLYFELRRDDGRFAPCPLPSAAPLISGVLAEAAKRLQEVRPSEFEMFNRLIRGRGAGPEDLFQRVRLLPIPSVGSRHVDPSIRRILLEVPTNCPIRADDLEWALAGVEAHDPKTGEVWSGRLVSTNDDPMVERFMAAASSFRSLTPAVLPRASRRRIGGGGIKPAAERIREEQRAASSVLHALRHAKVRVRPSKIRVQKEPFLRRGARAEPFAAGTRFSKHALWHVELEFAEAVAGPLVIGDGRFCGLGLMQPVSREVSVYGFDLGAEVRLGLDERVAVVRSLRRALMAVARNGKGQVDRLFSGHEPGGQVARSGHHTHVFLAADGAAAASGSFERLIVVAPWAADRRASRTRRSVQLFNEVTPRLRELKAGRAGRFARLIATPVAEGDPLLGPSCSWIGQTDYVATRNLKQRKDGATMVRDDVVAECVRRGLPIPIEVGVLRVASGPRGGCPTARVNLRFALAISGPVLLGRDSHMGGGLFHAEREKSPP